MRQIITHKGGASALLGVGLAGTIWGRRLTWAPSRGAANVIWEAKRGRSWYRQWPFNVAVTLVALVLVTMVLMGLVLTGPIAKSVGEQLGIGSTGLAIWGIAKWPTIVGAVALMITGLYYVAPDVRPPSWPWLTPGAMLAVIVWALTSVGFGLYIANFGTRPIEVSRPPEMRRQSPSDRTRLIDVRCGAHLPTIPSWRATSQADISHGAPRLR